MNGSDSETGPGPDPRLDRLYELLPVYYRLRDAESGQPLRALLQVIAEQVNVVEDDISQLYDNWFIETCQDWVVPYIADLIGYRPVHGTGAPGAGSPAGGGLRNRILVPRREVAATLRYRRRKGTLALLELLARDVAGWPASSVEFYQLLAGSQHLNHLRPERARTLDLRRVTRSNASKAPSTRRRTQRACGGSALATSQAATPSRTWDSSSGA